MAADRAGAPPRAWQRMQQGEQEDDQYALRQHQQRPERHPGGNQGAENDDRAEMGSELGEPWPVRLAGQATALLVRQRGDDVAMIHCSSQWLEFGDSH